MKVKCKNCDKEFSDKPNGKPLKVYEHEGEFICEECLAGRGPLPPHDEKDHDHVVWLYSTLYYGRQI